jgi:ribosomal protein L30E
VEDSAADERPLEHLPGISVTKAASVSSFAAAGEPITYTFLVSNQGNVPLRDVTVHDTKLGDVCGGPFTLAVSETRTCTVHYTTTAADVAAGHIVNAVTATGMPPSGPPVQDSAADGIPLEHLPGISVTKHASVFSFAVEGEPVTYTFLVSNQGNVPLSDVTVHDTKLGDVCNGPFDLPAGGARECTVHYVTTAEDVAAGHIVNAVTATGDPPSGPPVQDSVADEIPLGQLPGIFITKDSDVSAFSAAGEPITYDFLVTDGGNVPLHDVTVDDTKLGDVCGAPFDLPVGGVRECEVHYETTAGDVEAGHISNSVLALGDPPSGPPVEDTASEEILLEELPGISVTKHAGVSSFDARRQPVSYTFLVTNKGNVPLHHVTAHDNKLGNVCGRPFNLPLGGVRRCTARYVTTAADVAVGHIANAVTVTGVPPSGGPPVRATARDNVPLKEHLAITAPFMPVTG